MQRLCLWEVLWQHFWAELSSGRSICRRSRDRAMLCKVAQPRMMPAQKFYRGKQSGRVERGLIWRKAAGLPSVRCCCRICPVPRCPDGPRRQTRKWPAHWQSDDERPRRAVVCECGGRSGHRPDQIRKTVDSNRDPVRCAGYVSSVLNEWARQGVTEVGQIGAGQGLSGMYPPPAITRKSPAEHCTAADVAS